MALVFDLESNALEISQTDVVWLICTRDLDTGERHTFSDFDPKAKPLKKFKKFFSKHKKFVGHNIIMYDLPVLKHLTGWEPPANATLVDTLLLSQLSNYNRRETNKAHGLAAWGDYFKVPKPIHEDWHNWSSEMTKRCRDDTDINYLTYFFLLEEFGDQLHAFPELLDSFHDEQTIAQMSAIQVATGWNFNQKACAKLLKKIEKKMAKIEKKIKPSLPPKVIKDQLAQRVKQPAWRKDGRYHTRITQYFGLDPDDYSTVLGPYCRFKHEPADLGSIALVKDMLLDQGWVPDEWNYKKDPETGRFMRDPITKQRIRTSPKLTEESIGRIDGKLGKELAYFYTIRSRHSILSGLLHTAQQGDGRVRCRPRTIGTPSFRMTHQEVVNIPSKGILGPECRELFIADKGRLILGCDSKGNQARALAHYVNNEDFTQAIIYGNEADGTDIHSRNCVSINDAVESVTDKRATRGTAKTILYAVLFGAGPEKVGSYLMGRPDPEIGSVIITAMVDGMPGFRDLVDKIEDEYEWSLRTNKGRAYITCLDGRRAYCDSKHKALNYKLQSFEAITVKSSIALAWKRLKKFDIQPLTIMHDEWQTGIWPDDKEAITEILLDSFREAPKKYNVMIHEGDVKIGHSWKESH